MTAITAPTAPVFASYPTPAGGHVNLTDHGPENTWRYRSHCTGCPFEDGYRTTEAAHRHAQAHAKKCYEQPDRPAVQLPTAPDALADHILTVGDTGLIADLTAQIGGPTARRALAEAYSIAATRLWNS